MLNHILRKQRTEQNDISFIIKTQRENYFEKPENKYFGMRYCHLQFKDEDMRHFINRKSVSNFDLASAVEAVINTENSDLNKLSSKSNTMEFINLVAHPDFMNLSHL